MPVENISQLQELWQNIDQIQADQLGEGQLNVKRHIAAAATSATVALSKTAGEIAKTEHGKMQGAAKKQEVQAPPPPQSDDSDYWPYDPSSQQPQFDTSIPYLPNGQIDWNKLSQDIRAMLAQLNAQPQNLNVMVGAFQLLSSISQLEAGSTNIPPEIQKEINDAMGTDISDGQGGNLMSQMVDVILRCAYVQYGKSAADQLLVQMRNGMYGGVGLGWTGDAFNELQYLSASSNGSVTNWDAWMNSNSMDGNGQIPALNIDGVLIPFDGGNGNNDLNMSDFIFLQTGLVGSEVSNAAGITLHDLYQSLTQDQLDDIQSKPKGMQLILLLMYLADQEDDKQLSIGGTGMVSNMITKGSNFVSQLMNMFSTSNGWNAQTANQFMGILSYVKRFADTNPAMAQISGQIDSAVNFFQNLTDGSGGKPGTGNTLLQDFQNGDTNDLIAGLQQFSPSSGNQGNVDLFRQGVQNLGQLSQSLTSQSSATLQMMNAQTTAANSENAALKSALIDNYAGWLKYLCDHQIAGQ